MTAVLNSKSVFITEKDGAPSTSGYSGYPSDTAGEGAGTELVTIEDQITLPVTFFSATSNYARVLRIPTRAKLKKLELFTDAAIDSAASTSAAAFKVGLAFSDSVIDGTPSAFQGLVPSTVGLLAAAAGTVVALPSTSGANDIFGTVTCPATTAAIPLTDVTFLGGATYAASPLALVQSPLISIFNFLDGRGAVINEMGYFDVFIMSSHAYTTVPSTTANLLVRAQYADE